MTFDPNNKGISVFVDVNNLGEVITALTGETVIADRQYSFFFFVDQSVADEIDNYKVIINNFQPQLVRKEA